MQNNSPEIKDIYPNKDENIVLPGMKSGSGSDKKEPEILGKTTNPKSVTDITKIPEKFMYIKNETSKIPPRLREVIRLSIVGFILVFVMNVFNVYLVATSLKDDVINSAYSGFEGLLEAGENVSKANFEEAYSSFDNSYKDFESAQSDLWFLSDNQDLFIKNDKTADSAEGIILSGKHLSQAGLYFSESIQSLSEIMDMVVKENYKDDEYRASITNILKREVEQVKLAYDEIKEAEFQLNRVHYSVLPEDIVPKFDLAKDSLGVLLAEIEGMYEDIPVLMELLGDRYPHRYLILFQNDNEIRPTGGFIGSFMIMDLNDGYITKKDIHDVYEYDNVFFEHVDAPYEIAELTDEWRFRDSNYSPDFEVSAKKAAWFLEKEGGPSVDTVIALNQSVIRDIVEDFGEINVEGLPLPLNRDNFTFMISYIVEAKIKGKNNPKIILNDLMDSFTGKLLEKDKLAEVFKTVSTSIAEKEIMAYSKDEDIQSFFDKYGLTGKVVHPKDEEDYLSVVATSISGNKSDRLMEQDIVHETSIDNTGEVINRVTISRKHNFTPQMGRQWDSLIGDFGFDYFPDYLKDIMGRGGNRVIMRIYVPKGSEIIDVEGFDVNAVDTRYDQELDKTYFKLTVFTKAGEENTFSIRYLLPFDIDFSPVNDYKLITQKQPGPFESSFAKKLYLPANLTMLRYYPEDVYWDENNVTSYNSILNTDRNFAVLLTEKD